MSKRFRRNADSVQPTFMQFFQKEFFNILEEERKKEKLNLKRQKKM